MPCQGSSNQTAFRRRDDLQTLLGHIGLTKALVGGRVGFTSSSLWEPRCGRGRRRCRPIGGARGRSAPERGKAAVLDFLFGECQRFGRATRRSVERAERKIDEVQKPGNVAVVTLGVGRMMVMPRRVGVPIAFGFR